MATIGRPLLYRDSSLDYDKRQSYNQVTVSAVIVSYFYDHDTYCAVCRLCTSGIGKRSTVNLCRMRFTLGKFLLILVPVGVYSCQELSGILVCLNTIRLKALLSVPESFNCVRKMMYFQLFIGCNYSRRNTSTNINKSRFGFDAS